jgi:diguanylate cyclase (GGDEF)-like protein
VLHNNSTSTSTHDIARIESSKKSVRKYLGIIAIIISLVLVSIFFAFQFNVSQALQMHLHEQAKAFFSEIVLVRKWVAMHGGVYVPLDKTTGINPYLAQIENAKTTITCGDKVFVLKNPSLVTKELSELPCRSDQVRYKMTSLKPINPDNAPDKFETAALIQFEQGVSEVSALEKNDGTTLFRYMAPLMTDETCLPCHAQQGYVMGDVRGGIAVSLQADQFTLKIRQAQLFMILAGIGVIALVITSIWYISRFFIRDLHQAQEALARMAATDFLTGLANRMSGIQTLAQELARTSRTKTPVSIALMDLDHFKRVNDTYGHNTGDEILKGFSAVLRQNIRRYDTACRYGGEEFLLIMPQTPLDEAVKIANRVLDVLDSAPVSTTNGEIQISISAGVVEIKDGEDIERCIDRADKLLYQAKEDGRGRVYR